MKSTPPTEVVVQRAFARAGFLGNPSDGYNGKTISIIVRNFSAEVTLTPSEQLVIDPGKPDGRVFESVSDLADRINDQGYYGGERLLKAAIKRFFEFTSQSHPLHERNFTISFCSDIPRQVGLAGSSAIVTAALRALMKWYDVEIPNHLLASLTLSAENELGIPAGLQDRVIQAFEGVVFMDFGSSKMRSDHGLSYGSYEVLSPKLLPQLYVAFNQDSSEPTEVVHNDLRQRFETGDVTVVTAMHRFAEIAELGKQALEQGDAKSLHDLVDQNFDLRCSICQVQNSHRRMVEAARSVGASGKNCGSGGAIIGTYDGDEMFDKLTAAMSKIGCEVIRPVVR